MRSRCSTPASRRATTSALEHDLWNEDVEPDVQYFTTTDSLTATSSCRPRDATPTTSTNADTPSLSEAFTLDDHCAVAFLAARVTAGTARLRHRSLQHYDRQQVDACYGEGIVTAGRMNVDSKIDISGRWTHGTAGAITRSVCWGSGDAAVAGLAGQLVVTTTPAT